MTNVICKQHGVVYIIASYYLCGYLYQAMGSVEHYLDKLYVSSKLIYLDNFSFR